MQKHHKGGKHRDLGCGGGQARLSAQVGPQGLPPPQGNLNPKPGHAPSTAAGHGKVMNSHRDRDGDKGNQHRGRR